MGKKKQEAIEQVELVNENGVIARPRAADIDVWIKQGWKRIAVVTAKQDAINKE